MPQTGVGLNYIQMSLKAFHILFIALSTLLAFGFGAWCLAAHGAQANATLLELGMGSIGLGIGLLGITLMLGLIGFGPPTIGFYWV